MNLYIVLQYVVSDEGKLLDHDEPKSRGRHHPSKDVHIHLHQAPNTIFAEESTEHF